MTARVYVNLPEGNVMKIPLLTNHAATKIKRKDTQPNVGGALNCGPRV